MNAIPVSQITEQFAPTSIALAPNRPLLAVGGFEEDQIHIYDIEATPKRIKSLPMEWASCPVNSIVWANGFIAALGDGGTKCYVWSDVTYEQIRVIDLSAELSSILSISVANGHQLMLAGQTQYGQEDKPDLYLYDTNDWSVFTLASGCFINQARWNGRHIWILFNNYQDEGAEFTLRVLDVESGERIDNVLHQQEMSGSCISVADGEVFVSGNNNQNGQQTLLINTGVWEKSYQGESVSALQPLAGGRVAVDIFNGNHFEIRMLDKVGQEKKLWSNRDAASSLGIAADPQGKYLAISRDNCVLLLDISGVLV